ncbi:hypothetical protein BDW72DRAFT_179210 [Aspergillus terricola var. indicus]
MHFWGAKSLKSRLILLCPTLLCVKKKCTAQCRTSVCSGRRPETPIHHLCMHRIGAGSAEGGVINHCLLPRPDVCAISGIAVRAFKVTFSMRRVAVVGRFDLLMM